MIVGNGDIAKVINDNPKMVFFASGVSNSHETRETEYQREKDLLLTQNKNSHVVYFSSLSLFHPQTKFSNNRYIRHKKEMEELVKKTFDRYTIIRIGNITWGKNPHTLINALRAKVNRGETLEIENAYRYLITKNELRHWLNLIPEWSCEMNITGKKLKVSQIAKKYVYALK